MQETLQRLRQLSLSVLARALVLLSTVARALSKQGVLVVFILVALTTWRANVKRSHAGGARGKQQVQEVAYSKFLDTVNKGDVEDCALKPTSVTFKLKSRPGYLVTRIPRAPTELVSHLQNKGVPFRSAKPTAGSLIVPYMGLLIYLGFVGFLGWQMMGRGASGKVGKRADPRHLDTSISFDDIAGIDEAKNMVIQVVDVMKNPSRYNRLGARAPSGVLLCGPPGTGKTLLARVVAAQMKLPFFYASGSDFVEMFVGRGAARIRELFARATKASPSLVFLDELDAVGKTRTGSMLARNDEGEQTLNQLLACLDGIDTKQSGVVIIGATNRYDVLDPALTRPGRFDRVVNVELPDRVGREAVLKVHCRATTLSGDVDLGLVAEGTEGFSPAELASIVNEAIIMAVARNAGSVGMADFMQTLQTYRASRGIGGLFGRRR
uniref:AAA+ ATPase domain-containing protein n=1 Tax=Hemiselmis andersenii TaxID=464988 RepID=A0A6T8M5Q0_HEMAN|mmetsp:Transcript_31235/g.72771  ORF Transcript_31235/g.72771 Transcript_31235/m.72771 type:complete len:437 (+) Transcript_31235:194-1504(+)